MANAQNGAVKVLHGQPLPLNWREEIVPDRHRPGVDRARLARHGIAVWAIIGHLHALGSEVSTETIAQAAEDFRVPVTAITTALAYYHEHRAAIDTRLAINAAAVA
ncbi:MAG: hypothetical protein ACRDJW_17640 [Thermomicrobiales bacterium]